MSPKGERTTAMRATVALIGFMGVGKSAVGRAAAGLLGVSFVDCDELIERRHGSISDIFAEHGEQAFRALERDEVCGAIDRGMAHPAVIALGGGAVLIGDVRDALARLPHVVWLTAPCDVLWERVRQVNATSRPLARDEAGFRRLYDERTALYASLATDTVVNDGTRHVTHVAEEIARIAARPSERDPRDARRLRES